MFTVRVMAPGDWPTESPDGDPYEYAGSVGLPAGTMFQMSGPEGNMVYADTYVTCVDCGSVLVYADVKPCDHCAARKAARAIESADIPHDRRMIAVADDIDRRNLTTDGAIEALRDHIRDSVNRLHSIEAAQKDESYFLADLRSELRDLCEAAEAEHRAEVDRKALELISALIDITGCPRHAIELIAAYHGTGPDPADRTGSRLTIDVPSLGNVNGVFLHP